MAKQTPQPTEIPKNSKGIELFGLKIQFPSKALKGVWQEVVEGWNWVFGEAEKIWNSYILPPVNKFVKERQQIVKEEFKKETTEIKEEIKTSISGFFASIWEWLKNLKPKI